MPAGVSSTHKLQVAGLVLALAAAAGGCDRKNPLYLVPGKKEPPPGTANTPRPKPPVAGDPRHAAPPAR